MPSRSEGRHWVGSETRGQRGDAFAERRSTLGGVRDPRPTRECLRGAKVDTGWGQRPAANAGMPSRSEGRHWVGSETRGQRGNAFAEQRSTLGGVGDPRPTRECLRGAKVDTGWGQRPAANAGMPSRSEGRHWVGSKTCGQHGNAFAERRSTLGGVRDLRPTRECLRGAKVDTVAASGAARPTQTRKQGGGSGDTAQLELRTLSRSAFGWKAARSVPSIPRRLRTPECVGHAIRGWADRAWRPHQGAAFLLFSCDQECSAGQFSMCVERAQHIETRAAVNSLLAWICVFHQVRKHSQNVVGATKASHIIVTGTCGATRPGWTGRRREAAGCRDDHAGWSVAQISISSHHEFQTGVSQFQSHMSDNRALNVRIRTCHLLALRGHAAPRAENGGPRGSEGILLWYHFGIISRRWAGT